MTKELIVDASGKTVNVDTRQIVGGEKLRFDQQGVAHIDEQGSGETTDKNHVLRLFHRLSPPDQEWFLQMVNRWNLRADGRQLEVSSEISNGITDSSESESEPDPMDPEVGNNEVLGPQEELKRIAAIPTWFSTHGKVPALVSPHATFQSTEYEDLHFYRRAQGDFLIATVSPFNIPEWEHKKKQINLDYYPQSGEATLRWTRANYEDKSEAVVFHLGLQHNETHPFEPRWAYAVDYFSFDLPVGDAEKLLQLVSQDPALVVEFVKQIIFENAKDELFDGYVTPDKVIVAPKPGTSGIRIAKLKMEISPDHNFLPLNYEPGYLLLDGNSTDFDFENLLKTESTQNNKPMELDRDAQKRSVESDFANESVVSERLLKAENIRDLECICEDYPNSYIVRHEIQPGITRFLDEVIKMQIQDIDILLEFLSPRPTVRYSLKEYVTKFIENFSEIDNPTNLDSFKVALKNVGSVQIRLDTRVFRAERLLAEVEQFENSNTVEGLVNILLIYSDKNFVLGKFQNSSLILLIADRVFQKIKNKIFLQYRVKSLLSKSKDQNHLPVIRRIASQSYRIGMYSDAFIEFILAINPEKSKKS